MRFKFLYFNFLLFVFISLVTIDASKAQKVQEMLPLDRLVYENRDDRDTNEFIYFNDADSEEENNNYSQGYAEDSKLRRFWNFAKGTEPDNALYAGMWSFHFDRSGKFSREFIRRNGINDNRENNDMIGVQHKSIFAGSFVNSHNDQTVLLALSRNFVDKEIFNTDARIQIGHKTGLIWGYGDRYPNLLGVSPVTMGNIGLSYKLFGAEVNWVPGTPVVAFNTRLNVDPILDVIKTEWGRDRARDIGYYEEVMLPLDELWMNNLEYDAFN